MCAARVLSDFYDRVTVYERDELPAGPANRTAVPQGRHVHLLMARGAAELEVALPRSARRHGRRGRADPGEPAGLHPLRRRRDTSSARPRAARRVHRVRAEPPASGMADPPPGDGDPERRRSCTPGSPSRASTHRATGDRRATRRRRGDTAPISSSTPPAAAPDCRSGWNSGDFDRPPEASVDVGISYATHRLRIPGRPDQPRRSSSQAHPRAAARPRHALLRGRHMGPDDVRRGQGGAAARLRRNVRAGRRSRTAAPRRGDPPGRTDR